MRLLPHGQGSVEDVATLNKDRPSNSVINSEEEYLASVMDELFDPDQTNEALPGWYPCLPRLSQAVVKKTVSQR
jgi:hypothetical protein